jgi:DNA-binding Lrp family transcriptional regulator
MTTMSDTDDVDDTERHAPRTDGPARGGDGGFVRTIETAERDAEAARLRSRSMSYRAIAKQLGVSVSTAHAMVDRALAEVVREAGEAVVALELEKLDRDEAAVLAVMEATHYTVSNGKLIMIDGKPLLDDAPVLAAAAMRVRISESRRKLVGADAAQKIDTTAAVKYTYEGVNVSDV